MVDYLVLLIPTGAIALLAVQHLAICVIQQITDSLAVEIAEDISAINSRSRILLSIHGYEFLYSGYGGSVHLQPREYGFCRTNTNFSV